MTKTSSIFAIVVVVLFPVVVDFLLFVFVVDIFGCFCLLSLYCLRFLDRVVPPDQNFEHGYCGVFR